MAKGGTYTEGQARFVRQMSPTDELLPEDFDGEDDDRCHVCDGSGEIMNIEGWLEECPFCINGFDEYGVQQPSPHRTQEEEYPKKPGPGKGPASFIERSCQGRRKANAPEGVTANLEEAVTP